MATLELGVLVSGSGSNLQAVLDAVAAGALDARVRVVVSNRDDAFALERARRAGVPTRVVRHAEFADRAAFDASLVEVLRGAGASLVVLAGFMRVLTPTLLDAFPGAVVNIHPALLPSFPGVHGQGQALRYGVKIAGCTVHFVDAGTDTGPVIAQAAVPVLDDDDEAALTARILAEEHALLVDVLRWIAAGQVELVPGTASSRPRVVTRGVRASRGLGG